MKNHKSESKNYENVNFESIFFQNHKFESKNYENIKFESIFIKNQQYLWKSCRDAARRSATQRDADWRFRDAARRRLKISRRSATPTEDSATQRDAKKLHCCLVFFYYFLIQICDF